MDARFVHGSPTMCDYTPVAAVAAGTVIPGLAAGLNSLVAHRDLEANVKGALAIGGGVYELVNADGAAAVDNTKVYFDAATKKVTATATANSLFGYIVGNGGGAANSLCWVLHHPYA